MRFHADSCWNLGGFHASRARTHRAVPHPYQLLGNNPCVFLVAGAYPETSAGGLL